MTHLKTITVLLAALWLLSACGFKPLYATSSTEPDVQDAFAAIEVGIIEGRIGQMVRNHLLDSLNPYGSSSASQYILSVVLEEKTEGYGFRSDDAVTRESYTLIADLQMIDQSTGDVVFEESISTVQAYEVVQSDFANFSAQEDARLRTVKRVSELITLRLGMFFKAAK